MDLSGINTLAVVSAAIAGFLFGGIWYGVLSERWLEAVGKTKEELSGASPAMAIAAVSSLVMAFVFAALLPRLGDVSLAGGLVAGALIWLGFVMTTLATNHAFGSARPMLTAIDGGHWLGVLLIQGAVLGWLSA